MNLHMNLGYEVGLNIFPFVKVVQSFLIQITIIIVFFSVHEYSHKYATNEQYRTNKQVVYGN